jgi:uncharacterized repeat protein (TIGR04042 family)
MPELHFHVRWPDGTEETYYSPSTVLSQYLEPGHSYALCEFVDRCGTALTEASERVAQKYGYSCSRAMDELKAIEGKARQFETDTAQVVEVQAVS